MFPVTDLVGNLQFESCAVVGSSSQLRFIERGSDIDANDAVFVLVIGD